MLPRALAVLGAVVACLAGCSGTGEGARASGTTTGPAPSGTTTAPAPGSETGTGPASGGESPPSPAATSAQVSTSGGPCPYLGQDFVELTVGQHISSVVVTTTDPPSAPRPQCDFVRADGDVAASVRTEVVVPSAGLDAALARVPGGNPVDAGQGGSVRVDRAQARTDLAVFEGTTLVLVTINQASSLEATEIAEEVLGGL